MEIWKPIKGYEHRYKVSTLGNIKTLNYKNKGFEKILKPSEAGAGYLMIRLLKDNKIKSFYIHRLVVSNFISEIEKGFDINHLDKNKKNNSLNNLEIISHRENCCHSFTNTNKLSKYIGVSFNKNANKWIAGIKINGNRKHLGYFNDENSAYEARKNAEIFYGIRNKYKIVPIES